jgi:hypothetical protein
MNNKSVNLELNVCIKNNWPVFVVYEDETKELVGWFAFGEMHAKNDAQSLNNKEGPDKYCSCSWEKYLLLRDQHNRNQAHKADMASRM